MASFDIFNDDAFSVSSLTDTLVNMPTTPTRLGDLGLFSESGVTTTSVFIERTATGLSLVPASERGAPGTQQGRDRRDLIPFKPVHLQKNDTIKADEVQNVRAFGTENALEGVQNLVNRQLEQMRQAIDVTKEFHRIGALRGQVLDADGTTVLLDLFNAFGLTKKTHAMGLGSATTKVRNKVVEAKRKAEASLGGIRATGWRVFCSSSFWDDFVGHDAVEAAFDRWNSGEFLRSDYRGEQGQGGGFAYAGAFWEEYAGQVGSQLFVPDGKALLVPTGVNRMFRTIYAPADYMETVNTNGLPYYARQEVLRMNKGVEVEAQSNPLCINTRPHAVIELSIS